MLMICTVYYRTDPSSTSVAADTHNIHYVYVCRCVTELCLADDVICMCVCMSDVCVCVCLNYLR